MNNKFKSFTVKVDQREIDIINKETTAAALISERIPYRTDYFYLKRERLNEQNLNAEDRNSLTAYFDFGIYSGTLSLSDAMTNFMSQKRYTRVPRETFVIQSIILRLCKMINLLHHVNVVLGVQTQSELENALIFDKYFVPHLYDFVSARDVRDTHETSSYDTEVQVLKETIGLICKLCKIPDRFMNHISGAKNSEEIVDLVTEFLKKMHDSAPTIKEQMSAKSNSSSNEDTKKIKKTYIDRFENLERSGIHANLDTYYPFEPVKSRVDHDMTHKYIFDTAHLANFIDKPLNPLSKVPLFIIEKYRLVHFTLKNNIDDIKKTGALFNQLYPRTKGLSKWNPRGTSNPVTTNNQSLGIFMTLVSYDKLKDPHWKKYLNDQLQQVALVFSWKVLEEYDWHFNHGTAQGLQNRQNVMTKYGNQILMKSGFTLNLPDNLNKASTDLTGLFNEFVVHSEAIDLEKFLDEEFKYFVYGDNFRPTSPVKRRRSPSPQPKPRSPSPKPRLRSPSPKRKPRSPSPKRKPRSPSPKREVKTYTDKYHTREDTMLTYPDGRQSVTIKMTPTNYLQPIDWKHL